MAVIVNSKQELKPTKFERIYEDDDCISIWKYDLNKFKNGPIEVEYKYKRGYKHPALNQKKFLKDVIIDEKKKLGGK
jgi:hypothetical protein